MNDRQKSFPDTPVLASFDDEIDLLDPGLAGWRHRLPVAAFGVHGLAVTGLLGLLMALVANSLATTAMTIFRNN